MMHQLVLFLLAAICVLPVLASAGESKTAPHAPASPIVALTGKNEHATPHAEHHKARKGPHPVHIEKKQGLKQEYHQKRKALQQGHVQQKKALHEEHLERKKELHHRYRQQLLDHKQERKAFRQ